MMALYVISHPNCLSMLCGPSLGLCVSRSLVIVLNNPASLLSELFLALGSCLPYRMDDGQHTSSKTWHTACAFHNISKEQTEFCLVQTGKEKVSSH
jgi:hypothetical protein